MKDYTNIESVEYDFDPDSDEYKDAEILFEFGARGVTIEEAEMGFRVYTDTKKDYK